MNWHIVKLGEIAEFSNGINFDKDSYMHGIPLIGVSNFGDRFYPSYSELEEVKEEIVREKYYLQDEDIVFVRSNGNKELVGRCMLVKNPPLKITFSGFCIRCRFTDKLQYNPTFMTYYFKSTGFRRSMSGTAVGANIQNLSQGRLSSHTARLPDYLTQCRIAEVLSAYDDLIETNRHQIKLLQEAAQRLYKEWFVDLRYPGHENVPVVDGVPEGWNKATVASRVSLLSGYAFKSSEFESQGEYKIVTIKNVKDGEFDGSNTSRILTIPEKMPKHCNLLEGDILLSLTGNIGRTCIVVGNGYLLNQRVAKLESEIPAFTYCLFRSKDMYDAMNNLANGVAQQNLSPIKTGELLVLFPSEDVQDEFEKTVQPIMKKMIFLQRQNESAMQARDRLLPKLMSGEIAV